MQRRVIRWIAALAYAALIMSVSSIPQEEFPVGLPLQLDKLAHVIEYAILAFLVCRAMESTRRTALIVAALCCAVYGILDEVHQSFIPGRCSQVADAVSDAIGSLAGTALWAFIRKRRGDAPRRVRFPLWLKIAALSSGVVILGVTAVSYFTIAHTVSTRKRVAQAQFGNIALSLAGICSVSNDVSAEQYEALFAGLMQKAVGRDAEKGSQYIAPILYITLLDEKGKPIAGRIDFTQVDITGPDGLPITENSPEVLEMFVGQERTIHPDLAAVNATFGPHHTIEIGYSLRPLRTEVRQLISRNVLIAAVLLILTLIASFSFASLLTRPLRSLTASMALVREGDFDQSITTRTSDEIGVLSDTFNMMTAGLRERERIKSMFSKYLSKQVADEILKKVEAGEDLGLAGEKRLVTIMFADIRGFTPMSEKMTSEELVNHMNEYFTVMVDAIFKFGGTLDKFIGDGLMAIWNAPANQPDGSILAVRAALEMQSELVSLNNRLRDEGRHEISIGIGLNTDEVVAGNMGSMKRFEYTVVGDGVNLASRIESHTGKGQILISESTYRNVKEHFSTTAIEPIKVKGKSEPVRVFEVHGPA